MVGLLFDVLIGFGDRELLRMGAVMAAKKLLRAGPGLEGDAGGDDDVEDIVWL